MSHKTTFDGSPTAIYMHYVYEKHWLFMEKNRVIHVLESIRHKLTDTQRLRMSLTISEIRNSDHERIEILKQEFFKDYPVIIEKQRNRKGYFEKAGKIEPEVVY